MRASIGHSEDPSTAHATREVLAMGLAGLEGTPTAAVVFAAMIHDHAEMLGILRDGLPPGLPMIGCTTDGEISSCGGFLEDSIVLVLFSGVEARASFGRPLSDDLDAGVARALAGIGPAGTCLALPPGICVSGTAVVESIARQAPRDVVFVGATAGDQWRFRRTLQFCGFEVMEDALPLLWLGTDGPVAVGVQSGWNPVGTPGTVTEVDGNVVISIDGEPALGFFQRYFGDQHEPVPQYPLCVEQAGGGLCLRAPMAYDASGRVVFAGDVPAGATVRLSDADRHGILEGSSASVREALQAAHGPALMLAFSCAARKHVLGTRTAEEIDRITALTGALPVAGFYGYGEFLVRNGVATFHNETLITIALGGAA